MRIKTIEYNFYGDGGTAKLIVTCGRSVRIAVVVGGGIRHSVWFDGVDNGTAVRVGSQVFARNRIDCDLSVQGTEVRICANIELKSGVAMPIGFPPAIGAAAYNVLLPALDGRLVGTARIGGLAFSDGSTVGVFETRGAHNEFCHSLLHAAGGGYALFLAAGENKTFWKWKYASAGIVTPQRVYLMKGLTHLTAFEDRRDTMQWTLANPALTLTVRLDVAAECSDINGYRYTADAVAGFTLSAVNRMQIESASMPATLTHLGLVPVRTEAESFVSGAAQPRSNVGCDDRRT